MALDYAADIYEITTGGPWVVTAAGDPRTGGGFAAPLNSLYLRNGTAEWYQKTSSSNTGWTPFGSLSGQEAVGYYGDGSDGALVVPAGTTTLTRDRWQTTVVVQNGGTLITDGFRLMATVSITVDAGGVIHYDGTNASGFTGGAQGNNTGTLPFGLAGAAGQTGAGSSATSNTYLIAGSGSGGNGGSSTGAGGNGGVVAGLAATDGRWRNPPQFVWASHLTSGGSTALDSSCGGGGGGGDGANRGGGGGGGAGTIVLCAPIITNNGTIRARGGNGAAGVAGNAGGGGGGGGGHIFVLAPIYLGSNPVVTGGTAGAGAGTGNPGVNGSDGNFFRLPQ